MSGQESQPAKPSAAATPPPPATVPAAPPRAGIGAIPYREPGVAMPRTPAWGMSVRAAATVAWVCASIGMTGFCLCSGVVLLQGFAGVFFPFVGLFVVGVLSMMMIRLRRQRQRVVLSYLEQAVRLNLPLTRFVQAAAWSEPWLTRRRLSGAEQVLASGGSVEDALGAAVPECPQRVVALVGAGERAGQLGKTLRQLAREQKVSGEEGIDGAVFLRVYPLLLLLVYGSGLMGFMIYVMPKFREIFADFHADLPRTMKALIGLGRWFDHDWGWGLVVPVFVVVFLLFFVRFVRSIFVAQRSPGLFKPLTDRLLWVLPVAHGLVRDRGLADVCGFLAEAMAAGVPGVKAMESAVALPGNVVLREKMVDWQDAVERGVGMGKAAEAAGLPALLVGMVTTGEAGGTMPEVMEFLARYYRSRFSRAAVLLRAAVLPALVLIMGTLIGGTVAAIFSSMAALLNSVMGYTPGGM